MLKCLAAVPCRPSLHPCAIPSPPFCSKAVTTSDQTLINDTVRRVVEGERVVAEVRLAVREEMAQYKVR